MKAMKAFFCSALFLAVLGLGPLSANDVAAAAAAREGTPVERALAELRARSGEGPHENQEWRRTVVQPLGEEYMGQVMLAVRPNWGFAAAGRLNLACVVKVKVDMQGKVLEAVISRSSGNTGFDTSAVNAIIRTGQAGEFPPPPSEEYCDLDLVFTFDELLGREGWGGAESQALREQERREAAARREAEQRRIAAEEEEKKRVAEEKKRAAEEKKRARAELDRTLQESGRLHPFGPKIFGFQLGMLYTTARQDAEKMCKKREKILQGLNPCMDLSGFTALLSDDGAEVYGTMADDIFVAGMAGILESYSLPLSIFNYDDSMDKKIFIRRFEEYYHLDLECKQEPEECKYKDNTDGYVVTINFKKDILIVKSIVKESDLIFK